MIRSFLGGHFPDPIHHHVRGDKTKPEKILARTCLEICQCLVKMALESYQIYFFRYPIDIQNGPPVISGEDRCEFGTPKNGTNLRRGTRDSNTSSKKCLDV